MASSHSEPPLAAGQQRQTYYDGCMAVVLFLICQLLIAGLQQITASIDNFPAPILAMLLVAVTMILAAQFVANLDGLCQRYLRAPTDLLNRHMSIGFIVPFTMIMKGPTSSLRDIGLIIAGYILTGILNTLLVFALSFSLQTALMSVCRKPFESRRTRHNAVKDRDGHPGEVPSVIPTVQAVSARVSSWPICQNVSPDASEASSESLTRDTPTTSGSSAPLHFHSDSHAHTYRGDPEKAEVSGAPTPVPAVRRLACFAAANPVLCCSLVGIPLVGVPVSLRTHNDTALDIFLLVFLWTGTLAGQAAVCRTSFTFWTSSAARRRRARSVLAALLNAVLWSSLGTMAYLVVKTAARHGTLDSVLARFSTGTTLADLIAGSASSSSSPKAMGAGDLVSAVLDAGIVSWGLKLFDCRAQLLSRAGLTNLVVGSVIAMANILCGPLLMHSMGLAPPAKQLAFAARSVTLALAGPAMHNLGGDVGLNAAMVVFNGIVFQLGMGLGVYRGLSRLIAAGRRENDKAHAADESVPEPGFRCRMGSHSCSLADSGTDSEMGEDVKLPQTVEAGRLPSSASSSISCSAPSQPLPLHAEAQSIFHSQSSCGKSVEIPPGVDQHSLGCSDGDNPATVAAGMTVGINAAAMGTAYLYEDGSRAAPYAAVSMTVFGVMTVVFTSIQPLAGWVVSHTG